MEVKAVRVMPSPLDPKRVRLVGDLAYDDRPGQIEQLWFDVAEEHAPFLSRTGNPWLACLAPLAAKLGEPIRLSLPVDRLLLRNVHELMVIWQSWYPRLHRVDVAADTTDSLPAAGGTRTAAFFSGGVDSFFTILRAREPGAIKIDDLISIGGFDILLRNLPVFERRRSRQAAVAESLGCKFVDLITNLRDTRIEKAGWSPLLHGSALAAVGLALEGRYRRMLIGSTGDYASLVPLGSHPLTDPLHSTSGTQVLHDGATHNRRSKFEYLSRSEVVLKNLHVCFRVASEDNCGICEKCIRTMAMLELLGGLEQAEGFPVRRLDVGRVARVYVKNPLQAGYYKSIVALARDRGRPDIARAASRAMRRSRWRRRLMPITEWCARHRGLWRAAGPIRRALLAGRVV
jgi:hypothetical protein